MSFPPMFVWRHTLPLATKQLQQAISHQARLFWKYHPWWLCYYRQAKVTDVIFVSAQKPLGSGWPGVLAVLHIGIADHSVRTYLNVV